MGAGSSVKAGLPTAIQLTEYVEQAVADIDETLLFAFRFIVGAIQFGKACRGEPITDKINISESF